MASLAMTYTFSNSTTADATQVNTNFQDVVDATSDGTIDFAIAALTCTSINNTGNTTIGNASSDDLTVNASLASSIPIKTTRTYDIGSADLGLRIIYLAGNSTHTIAFQAPSSGMSADYSLNLPAVAPVNGRGLQATSTSATQWAPMQTDINAVSSADYTVLDDDGYYLIAVTTGNSNRTVTLPTVADNTDRVLVIQKADSGTGTVIIDGEGSEAINGSTTKTLVSQYEHMTIKSNGSAWAVVGGTYSPTNLADAVATARGQKSYLSGSDYNGGLGPDTTSNEGGTDLKRAVYIPYQMQDGSWWLRGNFVISHNSSTAHTVTIVGVTFKNTTSFTQACSVSGDGTAGNSGKANPNAGTISIAFASGSALSCVAFDCELESKPTWAY